MLAISKYMKYTLITRAVVLSAEGTYKCVWSGESFVYRQMLLVFFLGRWFRLNGTRIFTKYANIIYDEICGMGQR